MKPALHVLCETGSSSKHDLHNLVVYLFTHLLRFCLHTYTFDTHLNIHEIDGKFADMSVDFGK